MSEAEERPTAPDTPDKPTASDRPADKTVIMDMTSRSSFAPGERILGRYRIVRKLGQGAMAAVYLCDDEVGGIQVAVKTVPDELSFDHSEMSTIRENFRLVEKLHHPNIAGVKTLDKDEKTGRYFLILEYVPGVDGRRYRLQRGARLTMEQILPLADQLAGALDYAHGEKVVHRDIKPANVMITDSGRVKILDYGIASQFQESASRLTGQSLAVAGTGVYMAPEQWQGRAQDGRTDQYALATTLYCFFAGRPPFDISDLAVLREAVLHESPVAPEGMSSKVWAVFARALAKEAKDRYPSCRAFVQDMESAVGGQRTRRAARSRALVGAVLLAILLAALMVGVPRLMRNISGTSGTGPEPMTTGHTAAPEALTVLPRYRALVIGINEYGAQGGAGWNPLRSARPDAEAVADLLEQQYGFEVQRLFDGEASRAAIVAGLDAVANGTQNDAVAVYYAGHGFYDDQKGEGYWIPSDARRRTGERPAAEDWVWNSTISTILGSSPARHVLVMADSCFAGSLYRGAQDDASGRDLAWYRRALATPSRFLIASGSLEPVMDGGGRHSVFADQVLNFMKHAEPGIFSASELGLAIRDSVSTLTGQLVTMGPLAMASHAGGEFVFLKDGGRTGSEQFAALLESDPLPKAGESIAVARDASPETVPAGPSVLDAVRLRQQGATNSARRVLEAVTEGLADDQLVRALAAYLDEGRQATKRDELRQLVQLLSEQPDGDENAYADFARPRILACVGVQDLRSGNADGLGELVQVLLEAELGASRRVYVVEREGLEHVLSELNVGVGDLSDARAQLEIGRLLPASVLLLGRMLPAERGGRLNVRAVDTETSRVLFSQTVSVADEQEAAQACQAMAGDIVAALVKLKPLMARVWEENGRSLAGVGLFHGVGEETTFDVLRRVPRGSDLSGDHREEDIGEARIAELGELSSTMTLALREEEKDVPAGDLWVREVEPDPGE